MFKNNILFLSYNLPASSHVLQIMLVSFKIITFLHKVNQK
jgi:hypothetical protein